MWRQQFQWNMRDTTELGKRQVGIKGTPGSDCKVNTFTKFRDERQIVIGDARGIKIFVLPL